MKDKNVRSEKIEKAVNYLKNKEQIMKENTKLALNDLIREKVNNKLNMVMEEDEDETLDTEMDSEETVDSDDTNGMEDSEMETTTDDEDVETSEEEFETDDIDSDDTEMEGDFSFEETPEGGEEDWSQFDKYKVSDDEYDFTQAEEEDIVKIYKLLKDDDQIVIEKDNDNLKIVDNETNSEYLVDLNGDGIDNDMPQDTEDISDFDMEGVSESTEQEFEVSEDDIQEMVETVLKQCENCGVTEEEEEIEESAGARTSITQSRVSTKPKGAIDNPRDGRPVRQGAQKVSEANFKKLLKQVETLKEERQNSLKILNMFKGKLEEALVVNHNLGKIVKLVTEHSTTKQEKIDIIKRFGQNAKTVEQSKKLYESINSELNKKSLVVEQKNKMDISVGTKMKKVNETVIHESAEIKSIRDLMNRLK